jgi:hypothetical protein
MNNPLSRQEPEPTSRVTLEALYSETVSGCTFSARIRTGIAAGPNLQLTGLAFTRNSLLKKGSPQPAHKPGDAVCTAVHREWCVLHSRAVHIARHSQLHICSDAECTAVRVDSSGVYTCMEGVIISPVCTHTVLCTDRVIQFVRVYIHACARRISVARCRVSFLCQGWWVTVPPFRDSGGVGRTPPGHHVP